VDGQQSFDSFVFDDDAVFYKHIKPVANIQALTIIVDRLMYFGFDMQSVFAQFIRQAILLGRF
jgi:hypothetical protein